MRIFIYLSIIFFVISSFAIAHAEIKSNNNLKYGIGYDDGLSIRFLKNKRLNWDLSLYLNYSSSKPSIVDYSYAEDNNYFRLSPGISYNLKDNKDFKLNIRIIFPLTFGRVKRQSVDNGFNVKKINNYQTYGVSFGPEIEFKIPFRNKLHFSFTYLANFKYFNNYYVGAWSNYKIEDPPEVIIRTKDGWDFNMNNGNISSIRLALRYYF